METTDVGAQQSIKVDLAIAVGLAALAIALRAPLLHYGLSLTDEGQLTNGVQRLLDGQVLYRDFERNYTPGLYWLFVPLFKVFGPSVLLTRVVALCGLGLLAGLTYIVARPQAPRWAAAWAGLLPVCVGPPLHKMHVPLAALAGLALCKRLASPTTWRARLAIGVALGVLALFRQDAAVFAFVIGAATLATVEVGQARAAGGSWQRLVAQGLGVLTAGTAAVALIVVVIFAARGGLGSLWEQLVLDAVRGNVGLGLPFPSVLQALRRPQFSLFFFPGVACVTGVALAYSARGRGESVGEQLILVQWAAMALLMHSVILQRSDFPHLRQVLAIPAPILAYAAGRLWLRARTPRSAPGDWAPRLAGAGGALIAMWGLGVLVWGAQRDLLSGYARTGVALDEPRARVVVSPAQSQVLGRLLQIIRSRTEPGEGIFVAPYAPMLYFLSERPNATRHDSCISGKIYTERVQEELRQSCEAGGVRLVIILDAPWDGREERRFSRFAPSFTRYVQERYQRVERIGYWQVYERPRPE